MSQVMEMETLSDAWLDSCLELWNLADKHGYNKDKITMWHGFKHLYFTRIKTDYYAGRTAKGVDDDGIAN